MAAPVRRCAMATAALSAASSWTRSAATVDTSTAVLRWSGRLENLAFEALTEEEVERLEMDFAAEAAAALEMHPYDIQDMDGTPGVVSVVSAISASSSSSSSSSSSPSSSSSSSSPGSSASSSSSSSSVPARDWQAGSGSEEASWVGAPSPVSMSPEPEGADGFRTYPSLPALRAVKGIAYGALPCIDIACGGHGLPSVNEVQSGYRTQWGPDGRDDLATMAKLGANTVRLYHSLGLKGAGRYEEFLDRAQEVGLDVMPGFHSLLVNDNKVCPEFDCFETWKAATLQGLQQGFQKDGSWHPSVSALVVMNEPDFLEHAEGCHPKGAWCRARAVISAVDGILAAEKEAGVEAGRVRLMVTWSFAMRRSVDGLLEGPGIFGFQDARAIFGDPRVAAYQPRSRRDLLWHAYHHRWVHALNTQSPWNYVRDEVEKVYSIFSPVPWFLAEYGASGQPRSVIEEDLRSMQAAAESASSDFLGVAFFQFQTAYEKGGSERNFGLFSLGQHVIARTGYVCDERTNCANWDVRCLEPPSMLQGAAQERAAAVASVWNGSTAEIASLCSAVSGEGSLTPTSRPPSSVNNHGPRPGTAPASLKALRGMAYGALPCRDFACGERGLASEDIVQEGYKELWGAEGRDDLGLIAGLGANTVRLYHTMGLTASTDHSPFLNRARDLGLQVLLGYHTENANYPTDCPAFDCFETWKAATLHGLRVGLQEGNSWHPAVSMLILLNEPDFFTTKPKCIPAGPWCRVKAVLSALDGVLAAEAEAGISAGSVCLSVTWSFGMDTSIDGTVQGAGLFGFQDMAVIIEDPSLAQYQPRTSLSKLQEAYRSRWIHGLNARAPWSYVEQMVTRSYDKFAPIPWYLGEYAGNDEDEASIQASLQSMNQRAAEGGYFMGVVVKQFQTPHWKGGAEVNFGLFKLGSERLGDTDLVCDKLRPNCKSWPVYCLSSELDFIAEGKRHRAQVVVNAWGGSLPPGARGLCGSSAWHATSSTATPSTSSSAAPSTSIAWLAPSHPTRADQRAYAQDEPPAVAATGTITTTDPTGGSEMKITATSTFLAVTTSTTTPSLSPSSSTTTLHVVTTTALSATATTHPPTSTTSSYTTHAAAAASTSTTLPSSQPSGAGADHDEHTEHTSSKGPIKGISYQPWPCTSVDCDGGYPPSLDVASNLYSPFWSSDGRDDLGTVRSLGANTVRLHHSFGLKEGANHRPFLDRAAELNLNIIAGFHTESLNDPSLCPDFDCFETWKAAAMKGFGEGFTSGPEYNVALSTLVLMSEPENTEVLRSDVSGHQRMKAVLSALDGLLEAERLAGIHPGSVRLSVTWSFDRARTSVDGKVTGPGVYGFQDVSVVVADPSLVGYAPRSETGKLLEAYQQRWVHSVNVHATWQSVWTSVTKDYTFPDNTTWFVADFDANGQDREMLASDLLEMQEATKAVPSFLGAVAVQFQTDAARDGEDATYGLFSLGTDQVSSSTSSVWPPFCLATEKKKAERAQVLAAAWGGAAPGPGSQGFCSGVVPAEQHPAASAAGTVAATGVSPSVPTTVTAATATATATAAAVTSSLSPFLNSRPDPERTAPDPTASTGAFSRPRRLNNEDADEVNGDGDVRASGGSSSTSSNKQQQQQQPPGEEEIPRKNGTIIRFQIRPDAVTSSVAVTQALTSSNFTQQIALAARAALPARSAAILGPLSILDIEFHTPVIRNAGRQQPEPALDMQSSSESTEDDPVTGLGEEVGLPFWAWSLIGLAVGLTTFGIGAAIILHCWARRSAKAATTATNSDAAASAV